jgi:inorganic pyrophosphatase
LQGIFFLLNTVNSSINLGTFIRINGDLNFIHITMHNHPWHSVNPENKGNGIITALIEIPKGTRAKYEIDKESGLLKLDRVLFSSMYYPANYGFIPQSYCGDRDPLDIVVFSQIDFVPMCLVPSKVIGVMRMSDNGDEDDKLIAVAAGDPSVNHIDDISQLPQHFISELRNFFEDYKKLEKKNVIVYEFLNRQEALTILNTSLELYQTTFKK